MPLHERIPTRGPDDSSRPAGVRGGWLRGAPPPRSAPAGLLMTTTTVGYRAVLDVAGAINQGPLDEFARALDTLLASGMREVWVDLTRVSFIAGPAIAALRE